MFRKKSNDYLKMPPVNLDQFDDPIALNAEWTPFVDDTIASYVKLKRVDNGRLEFRPIPANLIMNSIPILFGLYIITRILIPSSETISQITSTDFSTIDFSSLTIDFFLSNPTSILAILLILFMIYIFIRIPITYFTMLGRLIYVLWFKTPIIDEHDGYIWKGRPWSDEKINPYDTNKKFVDFQEVYAIQLLPVMKKTQGRNRNQSRHHFYQVNLVLNSAERYGLALYSNKSDVRQETKNLAEILNVPVWDVA